jgi:hypothetical protein
MAPLKRVIVGELDETAFSRDEELEIIDAYVYNRSMTVLKLPRSRQRTAVALWNTGTGRQT